MCSGWVKSKCAVSQVSFKHVQLVCRGAHWKITGNSNVIWLILLGQNVVRAVVLEDVHCCHVEDSQLKNTWLIPEGNCFAFLQLLSERNREKNEPCEHKYKKNTYIISVIHLKWTKAYPKQRGLIYR